MEEDSSNHTPRIPNDVISKILCCLPAKTLVRFRYVCKSWQNLITADRTLINSHLQNQTPRTLLLQYHEERVRKRSCSCSKKIPADLNDAQRIADSDHNYTIDLAPNVHLIGSSRGLFCLRKECDCGRNRIFLWNPALRQCIQLSLPIISRSVGKHQYCVLVVGFDFDHVDEDYKLVVVFGVNYMVQQQPLGPKGFQRYEVGIYSLRKHSWKTKTIPYRANLAMQEDVYVSKGLILDGVFHWIQSVRRGDRKFWVNSFDMNQETFEYFVIPDYVPIEDYRMLGQCGGCLSISGFTRRYEFEVWLRKKLSPSSANSWVKLYAAPEEIKPLLEYSITTVTPGGKIPAMIPLERGGLIILYHLETGRIENFPERIFENLTKRRVVYGDARNYWQHCYVVDDFVESLVSIVPPVESEEKEKKAKKFFTNELFGCLPSCFGKNEVHA